LHENDANWESALDEVTALTKEDEQNDHSNAADINNSSKSSSPFRDYINVETKIYKLFCSLTHCLFV
jgi:hypothetical protein